MGNVPLHLLVVEGSLGGGYDMGLDNAVRLAETLAGKHGFPIKSRVVGKITEEHQARVQARGRVPYMGRDATISQDPGSVSVR